MHNFSTKIKNKGKSKSKIHKENRGNVWAWRRLLWPWIRRLFLYYCFSNNGVIEENYLITFSLELGLELYFLLSWESMCWVHCSPVLWWSAKTICGSVMWTRRQECCWWEFHGWGWRSPIGGWDVTVGHWRWGFMLIF